MADKIAFKGETVYSKTFWVENLGYRISIMTSHTHWIRFHHPSDVPEATDTRVLSYLEFLEIQDKIGILRVTWQDLLAAELIDNFIGRWLNRKRVKADFSNQGILLHTNQYL
jgi:hypothetical protein